MLGILDTKYKNFDELVGLVAMIESKIPKNEQNRGQRGSVLLCQNDGELGWQRGDDKGELLMAYAGQGGEYD